MPEVAQHTELRQRRRTLSTEGFPTRRSRAAANFWAPTEAGSSRPVHPNLALAQKMANKTPRERATERYLYYLGTEQATTDSLEATMADKLAQKSPRTAASRPVSPTSASSLTPMVEKNSPPRHAAGASRKRAVSS